MIFCPLDMIRLLQSNLKIFLLRKFCVVGFFLSTRGCNLAAHSSIHTSFILTRIQLPKGFFGLRILEYWNYAYTPLNSFMLLEINLFFNKRFISFPQKHLSRRHLIRFWFFFLLFISSIYLLLEARDHLFVLESCLQWSICGWDGIM